MRRQPSFINDTITIEDSGGGKLTKSYKRAWPTWMWKEIKQQLKIGYSKIIHIEKAQKKIEYIYGWEQRIYKKIFCYQCFICF